MLRYLSTLNFVKFLVFMNATQLIVGEGGGARMTGGRCTEVSRVTHVCAIKMGGTCLEFKVHKGKGGAVAGNGYPSCQPGLRKLSKLELDGVWAGIIYFFIYLFL